MDAEVAAPPRRRPEGGFDAVRVVSRPAYFTDYPRPILWLVPGGCVHVGGETESRPCFTAEVEPFYLSKLPVSNRQLEAFAADFDRSGLSPGDDDPALGVSFELAAGYCAWYAGVSRKPMRLPTEVEWEHACRAGATTRWFWGDDLAEAERYVWSAENSGARVPRLDELQSNGHGLYGMLGGAWEWTSSAPKRDPEPGEREAVAEGDDQPVLRGGSFRTPISEISCSVRRLEAPTSTPVDAGFRVTKSLRGRLDGLTA